MAKGLGIGLDADVWVFDEPSVWRLSPEVHYIFTRDSIFQPYVGTFYRRTFIADQPNLDTLGGRAGVMYRGAAYWLSLGVVYDRYLDCDDAVYSDCSQVYPEARFTFLL